MTRFRLTASAVCALCALLLSSCAGGGSVEASGTYYGTTGKGNDPAIMVVDGDAVMWGEFHCDAVGEIDLERSKTSIGALDKNREIVAWTHSGRYYNTDPFTESDDGTVVTMSGRTYSQAGVAVADAIYDKEEARCRGQAESRERAAEMDAEWEKKREAFETTAEAVITAVESGELSSDEVRQWPENGSAAKFFRATDMSLDEFNDYLANRIGIAPAVFFTEAANVPESARGIVAKV